jgi:twitching motility protein PilT
VSAQLEQILGYLDRPGVTEVVVGNGRPITFRRNHENVGLTKEPLSKQQLGTLLKGTTLLHLIPSADGTKPSVEIEIGSRQVKVTASRRGDEISFRIEHGDPVIELSPELPGRAKRSTRGVRTTTSPKLAAVIETTRAARTTTSPRAARTTTRPRTKTNPAVDAVPAFEGVRTKRQTRPAVTAPIDIDIEFDLEPPKPARPLHPTPVAMPVPTPHAAPVAPPPTALPTARPKALSVAFQAMVERAAQRNASDLHIATGRPVSIRVLGELTPIDPAGKPISAAEVKALLEPLLSTEQQAELERVGYVDLALETAGAGRLRTNISKFQGGLKGTFRIPRKTPATLEELNLPKDLAKLVQHHQGLVVVAGPSGHGKTTTLAALVDLINASRPFHIITVEDPIEIVYPRKAAVVSQREVGSHTTSFAAALKGSLREDPDVIVIGELRDRETVEIALTAAETGHLVIATMSTPSAAKTIDRLVDMFPPEDQSQVRASIAGALRAIVAQRLVPSAKGDAVYAAVEVLTGVLALSAMIREDKLFQLPNLMQRGRAFGMIRFDDSLTELVRSGKITADAAIAVSDNKKELTAQLKGGASAAAGAKLPEPPPKRGGLGGMFGRKDS